VLPTQLNSEVQLAAWGRRWAKRGGAVGAAGPSKPLAAASAGTRTAVAVAFWAFIIILFLDGCT